MARTKKEKRPEETFGVSCSATDFVKAYRLLQLGPKCKDHEDGLTMQGIYAALMTFMQESTGDLAEDPVMYASAEWFGGEGSMMDLMEILQARGFNCSISHGPNEEVMGLHIGINTALKRARKEGTAY